MMKIGVTGGIGSGKSFVCSVMEDRCGIPIYNSDAQAKRLINTHSDILQKICKLVGSCVINSDGSLYKAALAEYLFSSDEHAAKINAIVHPAVIQDFRRWCTEQHTQNVCVESALLFESGLSDEVDVILYVDAPLQTRLSRAVLRDNSTEEEIKRRMSRQDIISERKRADYIIYNGETETIDSIYKQLKFILSC